LAALGFGMTWGVTLQLTFVYKLTFLLGKLSIYKHINQSIKFQQNNLNNCLFRCMGRKGFFSFLQEDTMLMMRMILMSKITKMGALIE
uniref:hypothetical protein n=1 Tax=Fluoribacter gormanii TaxID=464 RepID=UPI001A951A1F